MTQRLRNLTLNPKLSTSHGKLVESNTNRRGNGKKGKRHFTDEVEQTPLQETTPYRANHVMLYSVL